jgi:hypothetical protein
VASCCEHGDEPSSSIKCGEFLDYLSVLFASEEGLCYTELVSYILCGLILNSTRVYVCKFTHLTKVVSSSFESTGDGPHGTRILYLKL